MDDSSASTSADPLTLPSSPLARHFSPRKTRQTSRPLQSRSPNKQPFSSPSKSFIMDTGDGGAEQSPWRIKVTVQAEPRNGASPSKAKTTTVPLKGGSSSPAKPKRPARRKKDAGNGGGVEESEMELEIKRPQRKRKGTPIRRAAKRPSPAKVADEVEAADVAVGQDEDVAVASSPTKKPAKKGRRKSLGTMRTQRGQRLSQARDELDDALQEAVGEYEGDEGGEGYMPQSEGMGGDMTAMNEDFTMISVETLESMKQNTSMLEESHISTATGGDNGSFWPSSPPAHQQSSAKRSTSKAAESASKVDYPNISAQAQFARDTPAKSFVQAFDAMSWKPTGRAVQEPTPGESSELVEGSGKKAWQQEREEVGQRIEEAPKENVVTIDDEPDAELGAEASDSEGDDEQRDEGGTGDDDIWAEEASRSLEEEDVESSHLSNHSRRRARRDQQQSTTAGHLNDLFSGMSSKPPRAKIPRTWRRSSGMDFQYSDSPAHSFAKEHQEGERKASGASGGDEGMDDEADRGSGVLTPPSTDEDDENEATQDDAADEEGAGGSKSVFEPDAAATELQVRHHSQEDSESEASEGAHDGEDTGLFWQNNLPSVYANKRPVRPQRKARDLSSLLKEDEPSQVEIEPAGKSSAVHAPQVSPFKPTMPQPKRFPGSRLLAARREAASSSFTSVSSGEGSFAMKATGPPGLTSLGKSILKNEQSKSEVRSSGLTSTASGKQQAAKEKTVSSPLRKSLLKSSKIGGAQTEGDAAIVASSDAEASSRDDIRQPKRRGPPIDSAEPTNLEAPSQIDGDTSLSFASKASDQRQLLEEFRATPASKPQRQQTAPAAEESFWHDAGQDEPEDDVGEVEPEEDASPARSVDYSGSCSSQAKYTDDYASDEEGEADEQVGDTTRSYEEHLNLSSPQKIRVNFGSSANNSSLLAPKRDYAPLFSERPRSRGHPLSGDEYEVVGRTEPSEPGLLSKLTGTIWCALIRPSGPIVEPVFPASLQTQLRSRYGVLSDQHPWTMSHMRTLHRMLNSAVGKNDTFIPSPHSKPATDLPSFLLQFSGKSDVRMKDTIGRPFTMSHQLALVVYSFLQLLVPQSQIEAMENGEIDFVGDEMARELRAYWDEFEGRTRHGRDLCFKDGEVMKPRPAVGSVIGGEWVMRCLGACVVVQGEYERGLAG